MNMSLQKTVKGDNMKIKYTAVVVSLVSSLSYAENFLPNYGYYENENEISAID